MSMMVHIAMFGWIPVGILLFQLFEVRKAIIAAYLLGFLFLPQAGYRVAGLPDYSRDAALNVVILIGVISRVPGRLLLTPRVWDLPIFVWCLCPIASSLSNGLGLYDGLSSAVEPTLAWGVPYWIGRSFFSDRESLVLLAKGIFIGGLICVPMCLWEARMGPHLHHSIYGFHPTKFLRARRLGGFRPMLFLSHGVVVGVWMCGVALVGVMLWRSRTVTAIRGIPASFLAILLLITALLCRALNGVAMLLLVGGSLIAARALRLRWILVVLALLPAVYVGLRATQIWHPRRMIELTEKVSPERAVSLRARVDQEDALLGRAWDRAAFGWGGYNRNRVYHGPKDTAVRTDSLWIIAFGKRGLVGLVSLFFLLVVPGALLWYRFPTAQLWSAFSAPASALAGMITIYAGDRLMNAMPNSIIHLMMGSVLGYALTLSRTSKGSAAAPPGPFRP